MKRRHGQAAHARLQLILAVAAIAAAVTLPVVLVSVGGGVSAHELRSIQNSGYEITVNAAGTHGIRDSHALAASIDNLTDVAAASPVLTLNLDAFLDNGAVAPVEADGVIPRAFSATLGPLEAGLFPAPLPLGDPTDSTHFDNGTYNGTPSNDVLLAYPFLVAHGIVRGESIRLGPSTNRSLATPFTVTGTFNISASGFGATTIFTALLPLSDLQVMGGLARADGGSTLLDSSDQIQVALVSSATTNPAIVSRVASEIQRLAPYYGVTTQLQESQQLRSASAILTGFYLALSSVGLTVGLFFLAIILVRRVELQRRSIGIRRAIGLPSRTLATEIAIQAVSLAALGVATGVLSGYLIDTVLARYAGGAVATAASLAVYDPVILGAIAAGVLGLAALVSLFASRAALRLNIPEALR